MNINKGCIYKSFGDLFKKNVKFYSFECSNSLMPR